MAEQTALSYNTALNDANTGLYRDGQGAGAITPSDHRTAFTNTKDSAIFTEDLLNVTASGTNTYTATLVKDPGVAYANLGRFFLVKFTNANTGASTIEFNSRGAKDLTKNGTSALISGDIPAGSIHLLSYDGTRFQIIGNHSASGLISTKITISSASVLTANATPVTLVSAGGAGTVIEVQSMTIFIDYNSVAYATNTDIDILLGTPAIASFAGVLAVTSDYYIIHSIVSFTTTSNISNQPLTFKVQTGNPTAGNSPVYVYLTYRIITL